MQIGQTRYGYCIGITLGGVIWVALLVTPFISWAMGFAPESGIARNAVFVVVGLGGFMMCALVGGRAGTFIAGKIKR